MKNRVVQLVIQAKNEASGVLGQFGKGLDSLGFKHKTVGAAAAAAAVITVHAFNSAINAAKEYEQSMAEVRTLTNASAADHKALSDEVRNLAVKYGELDTIMAKATYNVVSAGFGTAAEQIQLLEVSARAATAGVTDVNTAAMLITQSLNAYGESADQAAHFADVLFTTVKGGVTTFPELAGHLGKVTATAATVGITFEEVAAAIAIMTKKGINTAEATTALNGLLIAISAGGPEAMEKLDRLGITLDDGLAPALARIDEVGGGALDVLKELVPNTKALKAAASAGADGAVELTAQVEASADSTGAMDEAFNIMNATLQASEDRLKSAGRAMQTSFGEAFLEPKIVAVDNLTKAIIGLTSGVVHVASWVNTLSEAWGKLYATTGSAEQLATLGFMIDEQGKIVKIADQALHDYTATLEAYFAALAGGDAGGVVPFKHVEDLPADVDVAKSKLEALAAYWGVMLTEMEVDPETGTMMLVPKDPQKLADEIKKAYDAAAKIVAAGPPEIPVVPKVTDVAGDEGEWMAEQLVALEGENAALERGVELYWQKKDAAAALAEEVKILGSVGSTAMSGLENAVTQAAVSFTNGKNNAIMFGRAIRSTLIAAVTKLIVKLIVAKALAMALGMISGGAGAAAANFIGPPTPSRQGGLVPKIHRAAMGFAVPDTGQRGMDSVLLAAMPGEEMLSRGLSLRLGRFLASAEGVGSISPDAVAASSRGEGRAIHNHFSIARPIGAIDAQDLGEMMNDAAQRAAEQEVG